MNITYSTATTSLPSTPLIQALRYFIGYLTSPYATITLGCLLISKRIQIMAAPSYIPGTTQRAEENTIKLPRWSTIVLRFLAIVPLTIHLIKNIWYTPIPNPQTMDSFLVRTLLLLALSIVIEIFLSTTTNSKVMLVKDYSLFDMSLQYYFFTDVLRVQGYKFGGLEKEFILLETVTAAVNIMLPHVVKLFGLTRYRLWLSMVTYFMWSVVGIFCLLVHDNEFAFTRKYVSSALAFLVSYARLWVRIPSMVVVVLFSVEIVWGTLRHSSVTSSTPTATVDPKVEMAVEIREFIKGNTSEEFVVFSLRFAEFLLLRSPYTDKTFINTGLQLDLGVNSLESMYDTMEGDHLGKRSHYMLSGYLNRVLTVPEDDSRGRRRKLLLWWWLDKVGRVSSAGDLETVMTPTFLKKFQNNARLVKLLSRNIKNRVKAMFHTRETKINCSKNCNTGNLSTTDLSSFQRGELKGKTDLNRYITPTNYFRFLGRYNIGNPSESEAIQAYLLPESDTSPDYTVPRLDPEDEHNRALKTSDVQEQISTEKEADTEEVKEELVELLRDTNEQILQNPESITWYSSMHSIVSYELQHDKSCMTRSQYASENPDVVLNEVVLERCLLNRGYIELEDAQDERSYCVVCLSEPRNVVFLPCRCLALCDECRRILGSRGFNRCVCCSAEVEAYIRVNVV